MHFDHKTAAETKSYLKYKILQQEDSLSSTLPTVVLLGRVERYTVTSQTLQYQILSNYSLPKEIGPFISF